jgi:factor associated with neutral sphingomyelinase activation
MGRTATAELDEILKPMLYRPFHMSNLINLDLEKPTTSSLRASLVLPLQKQPGCVLVTSQRLYFQTATLGDDQEFAIVQNWQLYHAVAYARRYSGLKDSAVEIYWKDGTSTLIALERSREREKVVRALPSNLTCLTDHEFMVEAYREWKGGRLSNYEYLMACNSAAGRTFHDLSRYPVFPWVLKDYASETLNLSDPAVYRDLTKAMGALNPDRLEYFETRLTGMQEMDEAFLYGTHYSAPGYVLYYLVRSMPEHMLCLQNGKFDAPDRMFYSIFHCYLCALTNHADVKELIPEFFRKDSFDFLINAQALQLGATQTGDRVHDVLLPNWAKSARDFLKQNRKALESDHVTRMLPNWLDLIFGSKSRGEAALEAKNLFHPTAYLGPSDFEAMETHEERFQAELQAAEFGIVPDQLFLKEHPLKSDNEGDDFISETLGKVSHDVEGDGLATDSESKQEAWELLEPPSRTTSTDDILASQDAPTSSEHVDSTMQDAPLLIAAKQVSSSLSPVGTSPDVAPNSQQTALATPGGKARASWANSSFSLPAEDGTPGSIKSMEYRRSPEEQNSSPRLQSHASGSVAMEGVEARTIALSGSGEFSAKLSKDKSFSGLAFGRKSQQELSIRSSPIRQTLQAHQTGWDMKLLEKKRIHGDAVSGCTLLLHEGASFVATVSLDGSVQVNTVSLSSQSPTCSTANDLRRGFTGTLSRLYAGGTNQSERHRAVLSSHRSHTSSDPLACLSVTDDGHGGYLVFTGGHDDIIQAYGVNSACAVASVYSHRDAVTGLDMISRSPLVKTSALWSEESTHIMVSGSWDGRFNSLCMWIIMSLCQKSIRDTEHHFPSSFIDMAATVKVWSVVASAGETVSINREPLAEFFDADSTIVCLSATYISGSGVAICSGCSDGSFVVWICHDDGAKVVIHKEPAKRGSGPCSAVKWTKDQGEVFLFAGFSTGRLSSFILAQGSLIRVGAVSLGVPVQCLEHTEGTLLVGCGDGGLRLLPIHDGASFHGQPTLWKSVNGEGDPSLTCISIGFHESRLICSTGSEDGSIAIFELKRTR